MVVEENSDPNEDRVTFKCRNDNLGVTLTKQYSIHPEHDWLFKRVEVSGVAASGTLSVTVENVGESADILIVLQDEFGDSPTVKQRKWSKSHETGVELGYDPVEFSVLRVDGNKFISCEVGPGQTEITIN